MMSDVNDQIRIARLRAHGEDVRRGTHRCFRDCEFWAPIPTRANREGDSQPLPTADNLDLPMMHDLVASELSVFLEARKTLGIERYGQALRPFNGRDAGVDAFEELGDLAVYLRQIIFEVAEMRSIITEAIEWNAGCSDDYFRWDDALLERAKRAVRLNQR